MNAAPRRRDPVKPFAAVLAIVALVFGLAIAFRSDGSNHPTQAEMEADLICTTCHEPLDESNSPLAQQMKVQIREADRTGLDEEADRATTSSHGGLRQRRCSPSRRAAASTCSRGCFRSRPSSSARPQSASAPAPGSTNKDDARRRLRRQRAAAGAGPRAPGRPGARAASTPERRCSRSSRSRSSPD